MGFAKYSEFKRVKQLCLEKWKPVAYAGEFSRMKEILARHCVKKVSVGGLMDYNSPIKDCLGYELGKVRRVGVFTGMHSLSTAVDVLSQKCGYKVRYVLVARK